MEACNFCGAEAGWGMDSGDGTQTYRVCDRCHDILEAALESGDKEAMKRAMENIVSLAQKADELDEAAADEREARLVAATKKSSSAAAEAIADSGADRPQGLPPLARRDDPFAGARQHMRQVGLELCRKMAR